MFKINSRETLDSVEVGSAERALQHLGEEIGELRDWYVGRNFTQRPIAYDFVAIGVLDDEEALARYLAHPAHVAMSMRWKAISTWVVVDVHE